VTVDNPITELLASPLGEDSTIDTLAEQVLSAVARAPSPHEFTLAAAEATDRQARRLLRPLLACLAMKSAAEAGADADIYGGHLSFKRPGPDGPVLILGEFDNKPGNARITLQRHSPVADTSGAEPRPETYTKLSATDSPARPKTEHGQSGTSNMRHRAEAWVKHYLAYGPNPRNLETICYEVGQIYRHNWSPSDASRLASTISSGIVAPDTGTIAAAATATAIGPILGFALAAIAAGLFRSVLGVAKEAASDDAQALLAASNRVIEHFESGQTINVLGATASSHSSR
jgi:hypothetical protein